MRLRRVGATSHRRPAPAGSQKPAPLSRYFSPIAKHSALYFAVQMSFTV